MRVIRAMSAVKKMPRVSTGMMMCRNHLTIGSVSPVTSDISACGRCSGACPIAGSNPHCTENSMIIMIPNQKLGVEMPNRVSAFAA